MLEPWLVRRRLRAVCTAGASCSIIAVLLFALTEGARAQSGSAVTVEAGGQEATILADEIRQVGGSNDLLIAVGNVEITQGRTRLLADRVELNRDTGEAVAQGRVVFFDDQDRLVGNRVDYNLKTGTGVVYDASTFSAPFYRLNAERMDRIGPGLYNIYRGSFTTCESDEPEWAFKMGSGTVSLGDIAYGQNASFWLTDKVPLVPYVPFFAVALQRERQSGFLFPEYGSSNKKGFTLKIPYFWAINDSMDLTISQDTFSRYGLGVEGEFRYVLSQQSRGTYSGFFVSEFLRSQEDRERLNIPENRGYFSYRHDWQITPSLSFKIDANATTDDQVYREYGDRLHDRALQWAQTNVFITKRWDRWSLVGNIMWYQDLTNPAAVELQRVPEIKLQGLRTPISFAPYLQWQTEASFTNFLRVVGDGGVRIDYHPRVFMPIPVAGLFTVTPFAGPRLTFYNTRAVGTSFTQSGNWIEDTIHENSLRMQSEYGVEIETRASRVFELKGWGGIDALQHVIEPRAAILEIQGLNQKARPQFDRTIDNIGHINQIAYSLINRVNAKTAAGPDGEPMRWEMARLTLSQIFDMRKAINQSQPFGDLTGDFIFQPNTWFRFRADAAYNLYQYGLRYTDLDLTANYRDVALTAGYRYNAISGANYVTAQAGAKILSNLDAHGGIGYDVMKGQLVETRFGIDWRFQCFSISAEYVNRNGNENQFHLSVSLLGVGQIGTKMGQ